MKKFYDIHMHVFNLNHPSLSAFLQRTDLIDSFFKTKNSKAKLVAIPKSFWRGFCKVSRYVVITMYILAVIALFIIAIRGKGDCVYVNRYTVYLLIVIALLPVILFSVIIFTIIFAINKVPSDKNKFNIKEIGRHLVYFALSLPLVKDILKKAMRTITFFEIPLEYQFLVLDYYLKSEMKIKDKKQIMIGNKAYDKIVLCPLVIDFGRKGISEGLFYQYTPKTPVANQIGDLFYAIKTYYRFDVKVEDGKMKLVERKNGLEESKHEKLFEIYPFMGIDTQNYDTWEDIETILDKYFKEFGKDDSETRREKLFEKMGNLDCNMYRDNLNGQTNKESTEYSFAFAGIKLYPQLGFDPYPKNSKELDKVKKLYQYCIERRIPITTHCSDGGYKTGDNDDLTSPLGRWGKVLKEFKSLTLNFAHFGSQQDKEDTEWRKAIIELAKECPNVYTDIACNDMSKEYYSELEETLTNKCNNEPEKELYKKVLYGSDFSINMLVTVSKSYNQCLETFIDAELSHQADLCERNPERFLFGGEIQ
jgi:hypothetical protein